MEALIMSKFNHSNIVQFIGVCFDKHPRLVIEELHTHIHTHNITNNYINAKEANKFTLSCF